MSKYSVELKTVIELFTESEVKNWFKQWKLEDYLTSSQMAVVNEWGIFDKDKLVDMIIDAYYMREIGFETIALFKHYTKITMREIMGEYAYLIYSSAIDFDPLVNEDYTETFDSDRNTKGIGTTNASGSGFGVQSDTPQTNINKANLLAGNYASNTQADETTSSSDTTTSNTDQENYTRKVRGNRGISSNAPYLIEQYRDYIRNLYGEIIERCSVLFMSLY